MWVIPVGNDPEVTAHVTPMSDPFVMAAVGLIAVPLIALTVSAEPPTILLKTVNSMVRSLDSPWVEVAVRLMVFFPSWWGFL